MRYTLFYLSLIFTCMPVLTGCGHDAPVRHEENMYFVSPDISNQTVKCFGEDSLGYIWIGTGRGLNRFNGYDYFHFLVGEDSTSLCDNQVQSIFRDSQHRMWILTVNGISLYTDKGRFLNYPVKDPSNNALQMIENSEGDLFLNVGSALCRFSTEEACFKTILTYQTAGFPNSVYIDHLDRIFIVTPLKIYCYHSGSKEKAGEYETGTYIYYSYMKDNGEIWLVSASRLFIFDTRTGQFCEAPKNLTEDARFAEASVTLLYAYNQTSILINTQHNGLFLYNPLTKKLLHQSDRDFPFDVPDVEITSFFTDSKANLFIGSYDKSFAIRNPSRSSFNSIRQLTKPVQNINIIGLTRDHEQNLWAATRREGIMVYRSTEGKWATMNDELMRLAPRFYPDPSTTVYVGRDNTIWIYNQFELLGFVYENGNLRLKRRMTSPLLVYTIAEDKNGTLWLGGFGGTLFALRHESATFESVSLFKRDFTFIPHIINMNDGSLLISAFGCNPVILNPDDLKIKEISLMPQIKRSLLIPSAVFEDSGGFLWFGTLGNGVLCYDPDTGKAEPVTGLSCMDISTIIEDAHGQIWIGSQYGLMKYDKTIRKVTTYTSGDGTGGNQFSERSVCRLQDNSLVFGGTHGITHFNPIDIAYKRTIPVCFEYLKIHNKMVKPSDNGILTKDLALTSGIVLNHQQNNISVSFAALDYNSSAPRVKYSYQMQGFDREWIDTGSNREAFYSNLPAGKYVLTVRISNEDNTIAPAESSLIIRVKNAPWFAWWAWSIYVIFVLIIILGFMVLFRRVRENKDKTAQAMREKEQEIKQNETNMRFFANMSHEFRTPLTMIAGPVSTLCSDEKISGESRQLLLIVRRNVTRMLKLINQLLDFYKIENDTLKLSAAKTDIIGLLGHLLEVFRVNAKEKGIQIIEHGLEDSFVTWIDSDKIDKITGNLLANALKFAPTGHGRIDVTFDVINRKEASCLFPLTDRDISASYVMISVSDNGPGFPEDKLSMVFTRYYQMEHQRKEFLSWGTGIGLYYSRRLAETHHGYIKVANNSGGGAVLTYIIPTDQEAYIPSELDFSQNQEPISPAVTLENPANETCQTEKNLQTSPPTVLLVEDDSDVTHYLKILLHPHYSVIHKFDGNSALEAIETVAPDLIISDIIMPGMDGYTFCRTIKDNISYCHIPVVLLSAKNTTEDQVSGFEVGADAYITKPFEPDYLIAVLKAQLKNREKLRRLLGQTTRPPGEIDDKELLPQDKIFIQNLYDLMETELSNPELNINKMTETLKISRTKFYYKVKGLTGMNPNVFFKTYKLNRAEEILMTGKYNISEIADMTGFSTLSHFSLSFKKHFGTTPSEYHKKS